MSQLYKDLIRCSLASNEEFSRMLKKKLQELRISVKKFSEESDVPLSTLNKLFNENRDIRLSTFRQIVNTLQKIEDLKGDEVFVAVIGARSTLDTLKTKSVKVGENRVAIREYPATTIEDALKASVRAEADGAIALVCAPIVSGMVRDLINIPIAAMYIDGKDLMKAVKHAAEKATR